MRFISPSLICRFFLLVDNDGWLPCGCSCGSRSNTDSPLAAGTCCDPHRKCSPAGTASEARVKIEPGDLIEVNVYDEEDLDQTVRINDLGDGTFNFIGSVAPCRAHNRPGCGPHCRQTEGGELPPCPPSGVIIREYSTQGVSVVGEVKTPGVIRWREAKSFWMFSLPLVEQHPWAGTKSLSSTPATAPHVLCRKTPQLTVLQPAALPRR